MYKTFNSFLPGCLNFWTERSTILGRLSTTRLVYLFNKWPLGADGSGSTADPATHAVVCLVHVKLRLFSAEVLYFDLELIINWSAFLKLGVAYLC